MDNIINKEYCDKCQNLLIYKNYQQTPVLEKE